MAYTDLQYYGSTTAGGYFANPRLSNELRYALQPLMRFRQFVDIKEAWGMGKGDTLYWDKISNISTAGGTLVETNEILEHKFSVGRGMMGLSEYANSIPYTFKLEAFSQWNVQTPIIRLLRDDMAKVLDKAAGLQFKGSGRKYISVTATTGTFESITEGKTFASANIGKTNLTYTHVKNVIDQMKKWNIPPYTADGDYVCIGSINAIRGLKDDTKWEAFNEYGDPAKLFNGEAGRIYGCRFVEENNYLVNTLGSSSGTNNKGEAVFFGAESVAEGIAVPEEIRVKVPTDYGRSKGIAWYAILGFKRMWKNSDSGNNSHIIHFTSKK